MDDLISRQAAVDAIVIKSDEIYETKMKGATYPHGDFFKGMAYAENIIKNLQSTQKHGMWTKIDIKDYKALCSECGTWSPVMGKFCPECGAKMERDRE